MARGDSGARRGLGRPPLRGGYGSFLVASAGSRQCTARPRLCFAARSPKTEPVPPAVSACLPACAQYDVGITGGVESMESFQQRFFPGVYAESQKEKTDNPYCEFAPHTRLPGLPARRN